ncbi:hypothetical protein LTR08_004919 [Meristemomyces frigidus]|nr:hypothetical protein LTR08_004919 [Meristemomyces frigidus]
MPPKGMKDFVRGKNGDGATEGTHPTHAMGGDAALDEFKALVPSVPNGRAPPGSNQQAPMHDREARRASGSSRPASTGPRSLLYETDASNADKTSTASTETRANTGAGRTRSLQPIHAQRPDGSDPPGQSGGSGDEYESGDEVVDAQGHGGQKSITLTSRQRLLLQEGVRSRRLQHNPGYLNKPIDGDSYPSTTSGHPSVSDLGESVKPQPVVQNQAAPITQPAHAGQSKARVAKTQKLGPTHQSAPVDQQPQVALTQNGLFAKPVLDKDMLSEATPQFAFEKAPPSKPYLMRPPTLPPARAPPAAAPSTTAPQQHIPDSAVLKNPRRVVQTSDQDNRQGSHQTQPLLPDNNAAPQKHNSKRSQVRPVSRTTTPVQQQRVETAPEPESLSPQVKQRDREHDTPNGEQSEDEQDVKPKADLDYEASDLHRMEFHDLKNAKFDVNPKAAAFKFPDDQPATTLFEQLDSMSRFELSDQAEFMTTLDIDQWEEAGGWFLGRFGEIVGKIRASRQEKRKAAHCFEDEIQKRHDVVTKKRKLTENALSEMKASGAQVLQGTPKKLRKTK